MWIKYLLTNRSICLTMDKLSFHRIEPVSSRILLSVNIKCTQNAVSVILILFALSGIFRNWLFTFNVKAERLLELQMKSYAKNHEKQVAIQSGQFYELFRLDCVGIINIVRSFVYIYQLRRYAFMIKFILFAASMAVFVLNVLEEVDFQIANTLRTKEIQFIHSIREKSNKKIARWPTRLPEAHYSSPKLTANS